MMKSAKRARPSNSPTRAADQNTDVLPPTMPPEIRAMLGDPPLLPGEDRKPYDDLIAAVSRALKPADVMEWMFVEEVVYATHTLRFLRKTRAELLRDGRQEALAQALTPSYEMDKSRSNER